VSEEWGASRDDQQELFGADHPGTKGAKRMLELG